MNKILIVEDDANIMKIDQTLLSKAEFKIVVTSEGQEGLFKFKNKIFDLVICDINLPKKNGLSLIKECMEAEKRQTSEHYQRHGKCAYINASGSVDNKCREMANGSTID